MLCKVVGVYIIIDFCGGCFICDLEFIEKLDCLMEVMDLILLDIK